MLEILTFSLTQLFSLIDNPDNLDENGLVTRTYYDGEEFNGRHKVGSDMNNFLDFEIVYKGVIDESLMTANKQDPDELFDELLAQ